MKKAKLFFEKFIIKLISIFRKPYIVFESVPDYSDNTIMVYNELKRRRYDKKYRFAWYINSNTIAIFRNRKTILRDFRNNNKLIQWKNNISFYSNIKAEISCNRYLRYPYPEKRVIIYLTHGVPIKETKNYVTIPDAVDCIISPSTNAARIISYEYNYDLEKIVSLGYPRNDVFFQKPIDIKSIFNWKYKKLIIWLPTFRQHFYGARTKCSHAIPIIHSKKNAEDINKVLIENEMLVIIKPHFAQDVSYIRKLHLSNIKIINDDYLRKFNVTLYELLNGSDALLTDYSSAFCDYLLHNKPIGLIWEDIEDYKKSPGLYPAYKEITLGTHKIYNTQQFLDFLQMVSKEYDYLEEERQRMCGFYNDFSDGMSTKRVVDYIIKKANL